MDKTRQVAALPMRYRTGGVIEVLLITSRETHRWIIPKGWPWPERPDSEAAAREAWEEAGVTGTISDAPFCTYSYLKRRAGGVAEVPVTVFLLNVEVEASEWPESAQRQRVWLSVADAVARVSDVGLRPSLARLEHSAEQPTNADK
jgi:8-oxo-dGTP pyrophosphatase MutT (NUDIX family)